MKFKMIVTKITYAFYNDNGEYLYMADYVPKDEADYKHAKWLFENKPEKYKLLHEYKNLVVAE